MMNWKKTAILVIVAFSCGVVSFFNARSSALSDQNLEQVPSQKLFSGAPDAVFKLESNFNDEFDELIMNLSGHQESLAEALEDPCTPDEIILWHVENVIGAHEHMIRRVGEHVVELRSTLSADNRDYLMGLCAETVRVPISRLGGRAGRGRRENGFGGSRSGGRGLGYGPRDGTGRESGAGYGQRLRVSDRLARRLGLNEEQARLLQEKDPAFEADSTNLLDALITEREKLLSIFENPNSDDELLQQIDRFTSTYSWIERRITEHMLVLRPYLTVEQQKWLVGLCRRSQDASLSF